MKSTKNLSRTNIIVFSISLFIIASYIDVDDEAALGFGILTVIYGIISSSVQFSRTNRQMKLDLLNSINENTEISNIERDLVQLNKLKNNGLISEEEFKNRRNKILN
jgi:hypothetical protein